MDLKEVDDKSAKCKEARKVSIIEGCFSGFSSGLGDSYIIPFANALKASSLQIGMLSAFPNLISPLAQIYGSKLMEKRTRKKIVLNFVLLQSILWFPFALIALMGFLEMNFFPLSSVLVVAYSIFAIVGGIVAPAWFSWMGDIVEENERGKYFSKRNRIAGFLGILGFMFAAFLLDYFSTKGIALLGFTVIFSGAAIFRFIGYLYFRKQYEPELVLKREEYYFSFLQFLKGKGNFLKFSLYMGMLHLSTAIAGPFFALYMLRQLEFSYVTFMAVSLSGTVVYLILAPLAGKFSDRYGNLQLLSFSTVLLAIYPILWIVFTEPLKLIFITQVVGGLATATFAIGTTNFIYNIVTPAKRAICVSYMNVLVGLGVFGGSLLGGFLLNLFSIGNSNPFIMLFIFSSVLRAVVAIIYIPKLKELKTFEKVPSLFSIFGTHYLHVLETPFIWIRNISKGLKK